MARENFGAVLRETREQKGYDIATVARRLRIRVDVLEAIEDCDFSHMPPKGYARNMINAYARFLGLNPTEITGMYLDECYAHEIEYARKNARPTGFDMSPRSGPRKAPKESDTRGDRGKRNMLDEHRTDGRTRSRVMYTDDSGTGRHSSRGIADVGRLYPEERAHRSVRPVSPGGGYTNLYNGYQKPRSKVPFIIGGVLVVVVIVIILVLLFGPKGSSGGEDVQKVPVTGVTSSGVSDTAQKQVVTAPTKVVVAYEVASGQSSWIDVYVDKVVTESATINGPATKSFDVTGVLRIDVVNPTAVKVTQDGSPLALTDPDGDGVYSVTVDFPAILAQWQKDNPTTSTTTPSQSNSTSTSTSS